MTEAERQAVIDALDEGERRALMSLNRAIQDGVDARAVAVARTHVETGFAFVLRAISKTTTTPTEN